MLTSRVTSSPGEDARRGFWVPAPGVIWCVAGDATVLLSLDTGRYHTLRETGAVLWSHLCAGTSPDNFAACIATNDSSPEHHDRIRRDTSEFVHQLQSRKLVEFVHPERLGQRMPPRNRFGREQIRRHTRRATYRSERVPSRASCLAALGAIHVLLRTTSPRRLLARIYRMNGRNSVSNEWLAELARRIDAVTPCLPLRAQCLERSVCLLWMSRRSGASTLLRVGIQLHPFAAHAWVEHEGAPVNDYPEHLRSFYAFPPIEPDFL